MSSIDKDIFMCYNDPMSMLYTQEEIDKYFDGVDDPMVRAAKYDEWTEEWKDRCVVIDYTEYRKISLRQWIKEQGIRRVDYQRKSMGMNKVAYYFRDGDDYMAALLIFGNAT